MVNLLLSSDDDSGHRHNFPFNMKSFSPWSPNPKGKCFRAPFPMVGVGGDRLGELFSVCEDEGMTWFIGMVSKGSEMIGECLLQ